MSRLFVRAKQVFAVRTAKDLAVGVGYVVVASPFVYVLEQAFSHSVGYPASINGKSMQPALNPHLTARTEDQSWWDRWVRSDWVWVNCWRVGSRDLGRGDMIVYTSPKNPDECLIKRVIALEGDIVDTNGRGDYPLPRVRIPSGHVWVHGDNRNISVDSNKYGPVSTGLLLGVATWIIWPLTRIRNLHNDDPKSYEYLHRDTIVTKREELDLEIDLYPEKMQKHWPHYLRVIRNFLVN